MKMNKNRLLMDRSKGNTRKSYQCEELMGRSNMDPESIIFDAKY